jgi:hypothetical protein
MIRDVYPGFRTPDPDPDSASGSCFLSIPDSGEAPDTRSRIRTRNTGTDLTSPDQRVSPPVLYKCRKRFSNLFIHLTTNITAGILPK